MKNFMYGFLLLAATAVICVGGAELLAAGPSESFLAQYGYRSFSK